MFLMPLLRWWLLLEVIGLLALPLTVRLMRSLPERGLAFRRVLGLLLLGYGYWLLVSIGVLPNTTSGGVAAFLLLALISFGLGWGERHAIWAEVRRLRRYLYWEGLLFLGCILLFGIFRAYNPEIAATEKPMEFAFINGILRSPTFPPRDPWLANYGISYYYFGYVIVAVLTRLSALPSDITFNLALVTLFGLTVSASFGLVYNLVAARDTAEESDLSKGALTAGIVGAILVAIMGNLVGVLELIRARGLGSEAFFRWFDVRNLQPSPPSPTWYPQDTWWWWRASRVIHDRDLAGNTIEVISEFPFFSFLLGDVHPHVLGLPFVLLVLALALSVWLGRRTVTDHVVHTGRLKGLGLPRSLAQTPVGQTLESLWPHGAGEVFLWGLLIGGLGFLNTWDYPIYLALFLVVYAGLSYIWGRNAAGATSQTLLVASCLVALGGALYLPFYIGLSTQAGGIGLVPPHIKTQLQQFLLMFGSQLVMVAGLLVIAFLERRRAMRALGLPLGVKLWAGLWLAAAIVAAVLGWWTATLLLGLLGLAGALLLWGVTVELGGGVGRLPTPMLFVLVLLLFGLGLALSVEFVYLRDVFDTRMNTVFKFYYQAWVLFSVAAAYGLAVGWKHVRAKNPLAIGWAVLSVVLFLSGLSYTAAATVSKAGGFYGDPTLDGARYVAQHRPLQYETIGWLREHAVPDAVMVEAAGGSYSEFNWISAHTGIPTLLGWSGHQLQWRGSYDLPGSREPVIERIYTGRDPEETLHLLQAYGADYVIVGPLERSRYGADDGTLTKLDSLMSRAWENEAYIVYERTW